MTYFILINNQQQGPYTLDELRSRNITSSTLLPLSELPLSELPSSELLSLSSGLLRGEWKMSEASPPFSNAR